MIIVFDEAQKCISVGWKGHTEYRRLSNKSKGHREQIINKLLKPVKSTYDYVIIDCPPSVGLLTVNAMVASDTILLPLQGEYFAYKGVDRLLGIVQEVRENLNENLEIGGVFITQINTYRILTKTILEKLTEYLQDKVFKTKIRINVALAEAQFQGQLWDLTIEHI